MEAIAKKKMDIIVILFILLPLFIFSVFRGVDLTPDTKGYFETYTKIIKDNYQGIELSFVLISKICYKLLGFNNGFNGLLAVYSCLSFLLLTYIIIKRSNGPLVSTCLYISMFFLLHICIIIRAGIAALIFLWAINDIINHKLRLYLVKTGLCVFFHTSGLIMLAIYPFVHFILNKRILLAVLPIIGYFFSLSFLTLINKLINILPDGYHLKKFQIMYFSAVNKGYINIFSLYYLSCIFIFYFLLFEYKKLSYKTKIYCSILGLSIFFFCMGRNLPVIAYRIPEFLNVVLILLIPGFYKFIKEKWMLVVIIYLYIFYMLYNYLIHYPLINYEKINFF